MTPIVPLADLVAELRAMRSIPCQAAADRLEEMAGEIAELIHREEGDKVYIGLLLRKLAAVDRAVR